MFKFVLDIALDIIDGKDIFDIIDIQDIIDIKAIILDIIDNLDTIDVQSSKKRTLNIHKLLFYSWHVKKVD